MTIATDPAQRSPLALLLLTKGFTFTSVSAAVPDCSVLLLDRISTGRQPFPLLLARQIASLTGIDTASLLATTDFWTPNADPMTRKPVPPNPLLGDPIPPFRGTTTQPLVFPTPPPPVPELWVVGAGIGAAGSSGAQALNRNTGSTVAQVSFTNTINPVELAYDGSNLWTFGNGISLGSSYDARIDPVSGTLIVESDANHQNFLGICFEPTAGMIWACSSVSTDLYRYNPGVVLINPDASIPLAIGPTTYEPRDVIAFNGLLYVSALNPVAPFDGRIFELDPVALTILRSSTGVTLGNVLGICVDGSGNLWTATSSGGLVTPRICKTPISTMVSAQVPLIADPDVLTDPQWIEFLFGSIWFTDETAPNGRLVQIDAGGNVLQSRTFASGVAVGHVTADAHFLWYADKAGGLVHLLDPGNISMSPFTANVGGSPDGLLVLG